jgi:AcrR family transcriptional regulator
VGTGYAGEPWRDEGGQAILPGRLRVLRAARTVMCRKGVEATEVVDVAAAAGIGVDAMRCLFGSKQALLDALAAELVRVNGAAVEEAAAAADDPAEAVAGSVRHTVRLANADAVHAWLVRNDDRYAEALTEDLACRLLRSLSRGVWVGRFTISSVLVQQRVIHGSVLAVLRAMPDRALPPDAAEELATGILQMLGLAWEEAAAIATRPLPPPGQTGPSIGGQDGPCRPDQRPARSRGRPAAPAVCHRRRRG